MKNLFLMLVLLTAFSCTKQGDKQKTKYRIEASASQITNIQYTTRDEELPGYLQNYNQPTWSKEWIGYNSNEIYVSIAHNDQSGRIKLYVNDKLVEEVTTKDLAEVTTLKFEN